MPFENVNYTTTYENRTILKATTPKGVYKEKEIDELHDLIERQVGNEYLVVVVPEDVQLETIV